ncbi:MarR family winged helix-turn-helix transcriptional regulator [Oryzicola mucosus]|nr:MarR family winged helix-turn-helix transcriptional regulator [Oryzicola mucosus]
MSKTKTSAKADRKILRPRAMFFLNQANHAVRSRLDAALGVMEMTGIQYTVLSVIGAHAGLSSAELSRRFYVTPQTMNELISALERRDLIVRKADPANRRILRMNVTDTGRDMLSKCDALADAVEQDVFGAMPEEDYRRLAELARDLARHLRTRDEPAG